MKKYRFTATSLTNTMPFQVTPHLELRVHNSNKYLPPNLRGGPEAESGFLKPKITPRVAWRNGVPVIPATTFKGALRHLLSDYQTRGMSGLSVKMFNYLALGGIKPKGPVGINNSPNNREIERSKFPLVSLFGASHPVFLRGAIRTFPDLVPTTDFELQEVAIMRTSPAVRDEAAIRINPDDLDASLAAESDSMKKVKMAENNQRAAYKALDAARETGVPAEVAAAQRAVDKANEKLRAQEDDSSVQTGQLHSYFAIPAGQSFSHEFRVEVEDHELGLLLIGLREFASDGGLLGGQVARGAGCGLSFTYEVSVQNENGVFEVLGEIADDDISPELTPFVDAYLARRDEWSANITEDK